MGKRYWSIDLGREIEENSVEHLTIMKRHAKAAIHTAAVELVCCFGGVNEAARKADLRQAVIHYNLVGDALVMAMGRFDVIPQTCKE